MTVFSNNPSDTFHITMQVTFWSEVINILSFSVEGRTGYTFFPGLNNFDVPHVCSVYEINHNDDPHAWGGGACCGYVLALAEKVVNWGRHVLFKTVFVTVS